MKRPNWEILVFALILIIAAYVRFAGLADYFPQFWDEAKYLGEVEGAVPHFSVNPAAFALLKLGYTVFGRPSYAQIVFAAIGVVTVLGCFLLGRRIFGGQAGTYLGLLMAAQATVMPYFFKYSRHAFPAGLALCAFVFALCLYVYRLQTPAMPKTRPHQRYLFVSIAAIALLAFVPACSFNLLLPTAILFVLLEITVWRARAAQQGRFSSAAACISSIGAGAVLFFILPLAIAAVSGYHGWLERATALMKSHAEIKTMRFGLQCLYPAHLYHLCGMPVLVYMLLGAVALVSRRGRQFLPTPAPGTNFLLAFGFVVYVLFFGLFSHLQSARLYALTLPFVVYASSIFLLCIVRALPRRGSAVFALTMLVAVGPLARLAWQDLSARSNLKGASNLIVQRVRAGQLVKANAAAQVAYGAAISGPLPGGKLVVISFFNRSEDETRRQYPPIVMLQDGIDITTAVSFLEKYDMLAEGTPQNVRTLIQEFAKDLGADEVFAAGRNTLSATPYYYLEDVYSWRSYRYMNELMRTARDSVFVYIPGSR